MIISQSLLEEIDTLCKEYDKIPWLIAGQETNIFYKRVNELHMKLTTLPNSVHWLIFSYVVLIRKLKFGINTLNPFGLLVEGEPIYDVTNFVRYFKLEDDCDSSFYFSLTPSKWYGDSNFHILYLSSEGLRPYNIDHRNVYRITLLKCQTISDALLARLSL